MKNLSDSESDPENLNPVGPIPKFLIKFPVFSKLKILHLDCSFDGESCIEEFVVNVCFPNLVKILLI